MSEQSRKRRVPSGFEWTPDDTQGGVNDLPSRTTRIRHTNYDLNMSGRSSAHLDFVVAPASPEKRSGDGTISTSHDDDDDIMPALGDIYPQSDDDDDDDEEAVDPQYEQHLNQLDASDAPRVRRKRTTAVSLPKIYLISY